ncbi:MAG TPA: DUF11 domain-containing protein, partial [Candidatus Binatia bacterium]|nr:DUF11 domain-containing protein [Candidatus Binatia bacterium]
ANGLAVSQPFSFKAVGNLGSPLVATLLLTDGTFTIGSVSFPFTLGGQASNTFTTNQITINSFGPASPYPSRIKVADMGGKVTKLTVTISNLTHTFPADIDMLLVGPNGDKVMLMSDAGGTAAQPNPLSNVTLSFDASAPNPIPATARITAGTYRPANYAGSGTADAFPAPAPQISSLDPFPYTNTDLSVFNTNSPIGDWQLFVVDDTPGDAGSIGGWSLSIQTSDPVSSAEGLAAADLSVTATVTPATAMLGANVTSSISVTNHGPATASMTALLVNTPAGTVFVSASASAGTWRRVGSTLTWSLGSLASGAGATLTTIDRPTAVGNLASTLTVAAIEPDPDLANNATTLWTRVVAAPALSVARQNNNLRISWPADSGLKLQVTESLRPTSWTDVGGTPQVQNGQNVLNLGLTGASKFYRLRSP